MELGSLLQTGIKYKSNNLMLLGYVNKSLVIEGQNEIFLICQTHKVVQLEYGL